MRARRVPECPVAAGISYRKMKLLILRNEERHGDSMSYNNIDGISQGLTDSLRQMMSDGLAYRHVTMSSHRELNTATELGTKMLQLLFTC
ncbi:MAG: transcriptional regulator [Clostridium sp.]